MMTDKETIQQLIKEIAEIKLYILRIRTNALFSDSHMRSNRGWSDLPTHLNNRTEKPTN